MTSDFPVASTPTYCTAADVAAILEKPAPSAHADDGEANLTRYNNAILAQEDVIDRWCRTAFRIRTITDEYPNDGLQGLPDYEGFIQIGLAKTDVRDLNSVSGDKVEVWNGSTFENWLTTRTQGRAGDFYLVPELGVLKLRTRVIYGDPHDRVRVTYRYGQAQVPHSVKEACALLVAAALTTTAYQSQSGQGQGVDFVPADTRSTRWKAQAQALLAPFVGIGSV